MNRDWCNQNQRLHIYIYGKPTISSFPKGGYSATCMLALLKSSGHTEGENITETYIKASNAENRINFVVGTFSLDTRIDNILNETSKPPLEIFSNISAYIIYTRVIQEVMRTHP